MITLHIIIASVIFSVMFAYRNYWQIKITRYISLTKRLNVADDCVMCDFNKKWHAWQFALQIYIGVVIAFISFVSNYSALNSLGHGLLFGSIFWLVFDTILGYKLTNSIFHVDSNGIGTVYKKLFKKYAALALFLSKLLFVGFSVTLSILN
jgi:hypothetical protein